MRGLRMSKRVLLHPVLRHTARAAAAPSRHGVPWRRTVLASPRTFSTTSMLAAAAGPLHITTINHVSRETRDVQRLSKWYQEVMGFRPLKRPDFGFGGEWLELPPSFALHIIELDPAAHQEKEPAQGVPYGGVPAYIRRGHHVAFTVSSVDTAIESLKAHGIEHAVNVVPGTDTRQVFFFDPDGNGIEVGNFAPEQPPFRDA